MKRRKFGTFLIIFSIPLLMVAIFFLSVNRADAVIKVQLEQCANGGTNQTLWCSQPGQGESVGWVTGNSNAQKSTYVIGQYITYRFIFDGLDPNNKYCGAFAWDVAQSAGQGIMGPAVDYVSTFSNTNQSPDGTVVADPTMETTFEAVGPFNPDQKADIPPDPALNLTLVGPPTATFTATQLMGTVNIWGGVFTTYHNSVPAKDWIYSNNENGDEPFGDLGSGGAGNTQALEYCFDPAGSQVMFSLSGHIARPGDWGDTQRPSGSPYHMRYGSSGTFTPPRTSTGSFVGIAPDGSIVTDDNFGNIEVQLDVAEPTAITLQSVSATSGDNSNLGYVIAGLGLLSLATGMFLVLRKRQIIEE